MGRRPQGEILPVVLLTRKEFDQLLSDYEIASDFPSIAFAEELIELYPEAKVIIVERDVDS